MADGILSKIKMIIGVEEIENEEEMQVIAPAPVRSQRLRGTAANESVSYASPSYADRSSTFVQPRMEQRNSKVVDMQQNTTARPQQFKLVVTEPKSFEECRKLADNLKNRKPLILNLEKLDPELARKIFDFMNGVAYALDGSVMDVSNNIFVFAPKNVDLLAESSPGKKEQSSAGISSPWRR